MSLVVLLVLVVDMKIGFGVPGLVLVGVPALVLLWCRSPDRL